MRTNKTTNAPGLSASKGLKAAAAAEERKVEKDKGSELKKGAQRFQERAKSAKRPPS